MRVCSHFFSFYNHVVIGYRYCYRYDRVMSTDQILRLLRRDIFSLARLRSRVKFNRTGIPNSFHLPLKMTVSLCLDLQPGSRIRRVSRLFS